MQNQRLDPAAAGPQEADPWSPIEGVTVETYAQLTAQAARQGLHDPTAVAAWAGVNGVPPDTWAVVHAGWRRRIDSHSEVRSRYGTLYALS